MSKNKIKNILVYIDGIKIENPSIQLDTESDTTPEFTASGVWGVIKLEEKITAYINTPHFEMNIRSVKYLDVKDNVFYLYGVFVDRTFEEWQIEYIKRHDSYRTGKEHTYPQEYFNTPEAQAFRSVYNELIGLRKKNREEINDLRAIIDIYEANERWNDYFEDEE